MIKRILNTFFFSVISRFFSMGTNLFIIFFISRFMSPHDLGEYSIVFFFFQMFIVISFLGLPGYLSKEVALKKNDRDGLEKIFSEFLTVVFYGGILTLLVLVVFLLFFKKIDFSPLFLSYIAGVLFGLEQNLGAFILGKEKAHIDSIYTVLSFFITVFLIIIFKNDLSILLIFIIRSISLLIGIVGRFVYILKEIPDFKFTATIKNFKEIGFFWLTVIFDFFERQIDIFILSFFIGKELLGSYYLAMRIFFTVNLIVEVVAQSLTPFISRSFKGRENLEFKKFIDIIVTISVFSGIVLGGFLFIFKDFLISIFNSEYILECSPYLAVLAFAVPFKVGRNMLGAIMSSANFQNVKYKINLFATIIFILSLPLSIVTYSTIGGVFSRLVIEIIIFSLYFYYIFFFVKRKYEIKSI